METLATLALMHCFRPCFRSWIERRPGQERVMHWHLLSQPAIDGVGGVRFGVPALSAFQRVGLCLVFPPGWEGFPGKLPFFF